MNDPRYIVIHHSLTADSGVVNWAAIRRYHIDECGWDDIGYHAGIEVVGGELVMQTGRKWSVPGAHTRELGMNSKSIGICVVGGFDQYPPSGDRLVLLTELCWAYMIAFDIPAENVLGHREVGLMAGYDYRVIGSTGVRQYKTCPGLMFDMDDLRERIKG